MEDKLPKGQSSEGNGAGKPKNLPGIYRHDASQQEIITSADPNDGQIQADAFVRVGYHRVGDVPSKVEMAAWHDKRVKQEEKAASAKKAGEKADTHNGTSSKSVSELEEELAETKATLEALKAGKKTEEEKKAAEEAEKTE